MYPTVILVSVRSAAFAAGVTEDLQALLVAVPSRDLAFGWR